MQSPRGFYGCCPFTSPLLLVLRLPLLLPVVPPADADSAPALPPSASCDAPIILAAGFWCCFCCFLDFQLLVEDQSCPKELDSLISKKQSIEIYAPFHPNFFLTYIVLDVWKGLGQISVVDIRTNQLAKRSYCASLEHMSIVVIRNQYEKANRGK